MAAISIDELCVNICMFCMLPVSEMGEGVRQRMGRGIVFALITVNTFTTPTLTQPD